MRPMDEVVPTEPAELSQNNPDNIESNDEDQGTSTCSSGSNGFRVRGISEINDVKDTNIVNTGLKRKHCEEYLVNEKIIDKKSKCDEEATCSSSTDKDLQQDDENLESDSIQNVGLKKECHLNGSSLEKDSSGSIIFAAEIETREENVAVSNRDLANSTALNTNCKKVVNESNNNDDDPCSSSAGVVAQIKTEALDIDDSTVNGGTSTSNTTDIKPTLNVKKEEATSTSRESCKYGIRCYRRNPMHRIEEAHPGDRDYKRPSFPLPPAGTPDCPFGDACYRRNPAHFEQFAHPPETDFEQNWKNFRMRLRQRRQQAQNNLSNNNGDGSDHSSDLDDYDLEDPFINDEDFDQDYVPSDDDIDDEEYDDCDKAIR